MALGLLGFHWDREKRGICSTSSKMKTVYGSLSFPSFQLTQVKFGKNIIRGSLRKKDWCSEVCLKICARGGRGTLFCLVWGMFHDHGGSPFSFEAPAKEVVAVKSMALESDPLAQIPALLLML